MWWLGETGEAGWGKYHFKEEKIKVIYSSSVFHGPRFSNKF
jgi:hypothetical protein